MNKFHPSEKLKMPIQLRPHRHLVADPTGKTQAELGGAQGALRDPGGGTRLSADSPSSSVVSSPRRDSRQAGPVLLLPGEQRMGPGAPSF